MAPTCYVAARIRTMPGAEVSFEALAVSRTRSPATRVALTHLERHGEPVLVGNPGLRRIYLKLPESVEQLRLGQISDLTEHVASWLYALRAHGVLRLGELAERRNLQHVPDPWLTDPRVLACLGQLLTPAPPRPMRDVEDAVGWVESAESGSIAGLLRDNDLGDELTDWVAEVPASARALLRMPLYIVGRRADGGLRVGLIRRSHPASAFLAGDGWQWDVSADHGLRPSPRALRRDEDWKLIDPLRLPPTDLAWQIPGDPRVDRLFQPLTGLAECVLHDAASAAISAGARPRTAIGRLPRFRRRVAGLLRAVSPDINAQLLREAGLDGLAAPRLSHSLFLKASGNTTVAYRRRQAVALWPTLASDLAQGNAPRAALAIDQGHPLAPSLGHDYRVPTWAGRRLLSLLELMTARQVRMFESPAQLSRIIAAAGPHAPLLTLADLDTLEHWLRLLPDPFEEPWNRLLVQGLGVDAAREGWTGVSLLLARPEIGDEAMALLAWWHDLGQNIRDVLARRTGQVPDLETVHAVLVIWCTGLPITAMLRQATGWRELLWGEAPTHDSTKPDTTAVEAVIGPLCLPGSRVAVTPLTSPTALRAEGEQMQHCVGSYWRAVATARRLVCALLCTATGTRATVAWVYEDCGRWTCAEASGQRNAHVPEGTLLALAIQELSQLLANDTGLQPEALRRHRVATESGNLHAAGFLVDGACLVSRLTPELSRSALRQLPGTGCIEERVFYAMSKLEQRKTYPA